jgi:hypothetical protein
MSIDGFRELRGMAQGNRVLAGVHGLAVSWRME